MLLNTCLTSMTNMLLYLPTRPPTISFICDKSHYINCLIKKLGIENLLGNPTYTPTHMKEEILDNHTRSVLWSFEISTKDEKLGLTLLCWIPKLHKCHYKRCYILLGLPNAKSLTSIVSAVKTGPQSYCDTSYSRGGVNQMWILKNSKDMLEYM